MGNRILDHPIFQPLARGYIPPPTDEELAWLGGFADGEGTITLTVYYARSEVRPEVSVANTNLNNLGRARVLLRAITGRDVFPGMTPTQSRPGFHLEIQRHEDVREVLRALRPWLVGKRPQADLMLEYLQVCSTALKPTHRRAPDPPQLKALRLEYAARMRELNRRYRPGEWLSLHPDARIDRITVAAQVRKAREAEPTESEAVRTLLRLRSGC